jgi:CheY-like chemotaxis protein
VLVNLLNNAVKFTERGEVVLSVNARPEADDQVRLTFSVRDTGIGIPADRLDKLFQSFSQVDASTTRRYGGTGLGLAISRRLIELMGGEIGVDSQPGVGSTFYFTIAAQVSNAPSVLAHLQDMTVELRDRRLLVVDDNDTNRRIIVKYARDWGMQTRDTGSPTEALNWIRSEEPFDAIILDFLMPEMDGLAMAQEIRREQAEKTPPLILCASIGWREAQIEPDVFAAFLHKPLKPSQLFDTLAGLFAATRVPAPSMANRVIDATLAERVPLRILLAEDNVVNQKLAIRLLARMGYDADVVANGREAVDALEQTRYDVVLMDIQMPEMDGLEATRVVRTQRASEFQPRIVAMTANAMPEDRETCLAAGMDDYLSKPIQIDELVRVLNESRVVSVPTEGVSGE